MELKKQFTFSGAFRKFHEEDAQPLEISNANIYCYTNGSILIELDFEANQDINHKKFNEASPTYQFKGLTREQLNILPFLQIDQIEKEIVKQPYEGDYEIEGKTVEGWRINAIVTDVNSKANGPEKIKQEDKYQVRLRDLYIDYDLHSLGEGQTQEVVYGLANIEIIDNFSANVGNLTAEMYIESVSTRGGRNKIGVLSAEMTLKNICEDQQNPYETYYAWLASLFSFASGRCVDQIYRIKTVRHKDLFIKSEYWSGEELRSEAGGIAVIEAPHLYYIFIQQCAKKMTWETFGDRGVGLALSWYIDTFISTTSEVNFLILCTVLESLNKKYSKNASKRSKESLRTSLKGMFKAYGVPYEDLFLGLEFINVRNNIVHEGFGGVDVTLELRKLSNLVVRVFLAILGYQGNYMESRKIEIDNKLERSKHGLICRTFPFICPEENTAQTLDS